MSAEPEKKTPPEWEKETGIKIYSADGWAGLNIQEEWKRPITLAEFGERASVSTIEHGPGVDIGFMFPGGQDKPVSVERKSKR